MIIELIGTPGAGKTTLLPAIQESVRNQGMNAFTVLEAARPFAHRTASGRFLAAISPDAWKRQVLWQAFYYLSYIKRLKFALHHRQLMRTVISSQKQRPQQAELKQQLILHWFYYLIGSYQFLKDQAMPHEAILFDEGFAHRIVQFNASDQESPSIDNILAYLDLIPRPDLLIHIQAPPEMCLKRILKRGVWDFYNQKNQEELSRFVHHADLAVRTAVNYLHTKEWPMLHINNDTNDLSLTNITIRRTVENYFDEVPQEKTNHPAIVVS
jgi:thymidylate kinase